MTSVTRRVAVVGSAVTLAGVGLLGTAVAGTAGHGHGPTGTHGHGGKLAKTHLTVHAPAVNGVRSTVVGRLRSHHTGLANETISVVERSPGQAWAATSQSATTDDNGRVTVVLTQQATTEQYRLVFAGDTTYRASHSGTITIDGSEPTSTPTPTPTDTSTATPTPTPTDTVTSTATPTA